MNSGNAIPYFATAHFLIKQNPPSP